MRKPACWASKVALIAAAGSITHGAMAQSAASGEQVYARTCRACHQTGIMGSPKMGDRAAWRPLIKEGQPALTAEAWIGIRKMPPRGGDDEATLEEFARAVAHMARAAGADWADPTPAQVERIEAEVERRAGRAKR
jgi:cytochrome c5